MFFDVETESAETHRALLADVRNGSAFPSRTCRIKVNRLEAHKRKVGARGLMMIMEEILLESMYVLPSDNKVKDLLITKEMIERKKPVFDVIAPRIEEAA